MNVHTAHVQRVAHRKSPAFPDRIAKKMTLRLLSRLEHGVLSLRDGDELYVFGEVNDTPSLRAAVQIHQPRFYADMILGGSIGAAEAFIRGDWTVDDLPALTQIFVRNQETLERMETGAAKLIEPLLKGAHWLNKNTRKGARANIAAHYDLSDEFFEQFLDRDMMYSCAIFPNESATLEEASEYKLKRICERLELSATDHLAEIGTGWGGLAIYAAKHYGCRVTTATISKSQWAYARERVAREGLEDRVTVLLEDYRDLTGTYDKLVSVEMIEAVGHHYLGAYMETCGRLLKPDGLMLLQAINIRDQHYERAKREVDFIKRYIFPGSFIPSNLAILSAAGAHSDLRLCNLEEFGGHYARTLRMWRDRMLCNRDRVVELFSDSFLRMWDYYFSYCIGGFEERFIGVSHLLFAKPLARQRPQLPEI